MSAYIKKHPLLSYFLLAFLFTWAGGSIYYFTQPKGGSLLPALLTFPAVLLWYFGPCLAALTAARFSGGKASLRLLIHKFRIWQVGWRWYAFIMLYPLALHLVVVFTDQLIGGPAPIFFQAAGVPEGNILVTLIALMLFHIIVRGIGEETGWRGFALHRLQSHTNPITASLVLGILWALWHFNPANFPAVLSLSGIFLFFNIFGTTFIFTWIYNQTQGSLLIAILFHMTLNVMEYIIPIGIIEGSLMRHIIQLIWIAAVVAWLVICSKKQLGYHSLQGQEVNS